MNFEEVLDQVDQESYYDTRYFGGWVELVVATMARIDGPNPLWEQVVEPELTQEMREGRLGRDVQNVDWNALVERLRIAIVHAM